jgi:hypothetical protein
MSNIHLFSVGLLGFVGFLVNLLNRSTDGATVHALKSASEKELLLVRMVKLPFSLRVPKKYIIITQTPYS